MTRSQGEFNVSYVVNGVWRKWDKPLSAPALQAFAASAVGLVAQLAAQKQRVAIVAKDASGVVYILHRG